MPVSAAATDPGLIRSGNEDAFLNDIPLCLFAVADGLGGHRGGEVASRLAIETLMAFVRTSCTDQTITWPEGLEPNLSFECNQLQNSAALANRRIRHEAALQPDLEGMGTTLVAARFGSGGRLAYINVGDSRLYLWRGGRLRQVSEDDTWIASMARAGVPAEQLRNHRMQHMLTKALGSTPTLETSAHELLVEPGDTFLMCSDGLYGAIGDDAIDRILQTNGDSLDAAASALVAAANAAGGPDNITVVLFQP